MFYHGYLKTLGFVGWIHTKTNYIPTNNFLSLTNLALGFYQVALFQKNNEKASAVSPRAECLQNGRWNGHVHILFCPTCRAGRSLIWQRWGFESLGRKIRVFWSYFFFFFLFGVGLQRSQRPLLLQPHVEGVKLCLVFAWGFNSFFFFFFFSAVVLLMVL